MNWQRVFDLLVLAAAITLTCLVLWTWANLI